MTCSLATVKFNYHHKPTFIIIKTTAICFLIDGHPFNLKGSECCQIHSLNNGAIRKCHLKIYF